MKKFFNDSDLLNNQLLEFLLELNPIVFYLISSINITLLK